VLAGMTIHVHRHCNDDDPALVWRKRVEAHCKFSILEDIQTVYLDSSDSVVVVDAVRRRMLVVEPP